MEHIDKEEIDKMQRKIRFESGGGEIPIHECLAMNLMHQLSAWSSKEIMMVFERNESTVYKHLRGDCSHDLQEYKPVEECEDWVE